ncbi:MAG: Asp-tRNA(Asn)/Glu-tRNA(Gln) amidotransferase subunit GatB [Candidatus Liptonbacteria bacterium]|nr:Asp-tRNA(Asn)/Glu-tRNA(Gln) amidotransferase subunit GatB [Candidatus Liptonbacteria bacterium]
MDYLPTIGLEIHAELKTKTKMFCDSLNDPDEKRPNVNVCPVCLAHPGAMPAINKKAVEAVIKVGLALGGIINPVSKFDRKNYFYPDLPKGYQISQYDQPLVVGGELLGVNLTRIHLEEDTGTLIHATSDKGQETSLVDFNRAGIPLMELVTDPDIKTAEQAVSFGKELRLILRYLGVSDADMEKGQMRLEANISLREIADIRGLRADQRGKLGTKVEVKNINSFKALSSAIQYEIKRQAEVLDSGVKVTQETRGWDDAKQRTFSQRLKEEAHDYRYFPEPDLPPFEPIKVFDIEDMRRHLPELPTQKRERFQKEFGLSSEQAEFLVEDKRQADFFEAAASELEEEEKEEVSSIEKKPREILFNYLTSDLAGLMNESGIKFDKMSAIGGSPPDGRAGASGGKINPEQLAHLVDLIVDGKIMSRQAKDILKKMFETGSDPEEILESESLHTVSGEEDLKKIILEIFRENQKAVDDLKKGKVASLEFLVGKTMAKLRGRGNPETIRGIISAECTK